MTPAEYAPNAKSASGHWVLARAGKRVLRPGGVELTRAMFDALAITTEDDVVELAPGMGASFTRAARYRPATLCGVDENEKVVQGINERFGGTDYRCVCGDIAATGLPSESADVVYSEAVLSMQTGEKKQATIAEAMRVARPGARLGFHELVYSDDITAATRSTLETELQKSIRHVVRPATESEWRTMFDDAGLTVRIVRTAPMALLEPGRILRDEGMLRSLGILSRILASREIRKRVVHMRDVFRRHAGVMSAALFIVCR